jgi:hypothetical protein
MDLDYTQMTQGKGPSTGSCEHGNEASDFIEGGEFLNQLRDYQLIRVLLIRISKIIRKT